MLADLRLRAGGGVVIALWIVLAVIGFYGLIALAGYRHQSARPERRRNGNIRNSRGGNRHA